MAEDYYKTLGVPATPRPADIQKAYRELARKYHPDMNPDDKTAKKKFQEVQAAFDVLNNPEKRELYDRYGSSFETMGGGGPRGGPGGGGRAYPGPAGGGEDIDFGQFFGERFGGDPAGMFGDMFTQFRRAGGKQAAPAGRATRRRPDRRAGNPLQHRRARRRRPRFRSAARAARPKRSPSRFRPASTTARRSACAARASRRRRARPATSC